MGIEVAVHFVHKIPNYRGRQGDGDPRKSPKIPGDDGHGNVIENRNTKIRIRNVVQIGDKKEEQECHEI